MDEKSEEYIKGYQQGVKDFAERAKTYCRFLGDKANSSMVEYYIAQLAKEMTEKHEKK